ncbi:hypothetical protein O9992_23590 [Vibrio lentus]|nr:hypothetical protein [Vibrio lentus]
MLRFSRPEPEFRYFSGFNAVLCFNSACFWCKLVWLVKPIAVVPEIGVLALTIHGLKMRRSNAYQGRR